jgi:hypothetical protein
LTKRDNFHWLVFPSFKFPLVPSQPQNLSLLSLTAVLRSLLCASSKINASNNQLKNWHGPLSISFPSLSTLYLSSKPPLPPPARWCYCHYSSHSFSSSIRPVPYRTGLHRPHAGGPKPRALGTTAYPKLVPGTSNVENIVSRITWTTCLCISDAMDPGNK